MEMMFREAYRVVARFVRQFDLLGQFPKHALDLPAGPGREAARLMNFDPSVRPVDAVE
jgi:hypothetical protein